MTGISDGEPPDEPALLVFGQWPTPVDRAPRLAAALGLGPDDLWIKRDDLIGLGGGGNKVRKLQYSCAKALAAGATTLITTGAAQSNHARLTAAAAARLGLGCELILHGRPPETALGNLILDAIAAAAITWTGEDPAQIHIDRTAARITAAGGTPYVIPFGGSSSFSARGYVDCALELTVQLPELDRIVVALGSGGTMAGLVAALGARRVLGVHTGAVPDPRSTVASLLAELPWTETVRELWITTDQVGDGYASVPAATWDAIRLTARTEGIFLDPTYTGRAMASLMALCAAGEIRPGEKTVFLHTGGLPGLLAHPELAQ